VGVWYFSDFQLGEAFGPAPPRTPAEEGNFIGEIVCNQLTARGDRSSTKQPLAVFSILHLRSSAASHGLLLFNPTCGAAQTPLTQPFSDSLDFSVRDREHRVFQANSTAKAGFNPATLGLGIHLVKISPPLNHDLLQQQQRRSQEAAPTFLTASPF